MWELICHHVYCWGTIAADRSRWRPLSDGIPSGIAPVPNANAVRFSSPASRISIARRDPWLTIGGLRIEINLRFATPHGCLIQGDQSFRLYMGAYGTLYGACQGETINTYADWIGSGLQSIPAGKWVRLTFEHNGFNRMQLLVDDTVIASRGVLNSVPGVGPYGVVIGNAIGNPNDYLRGDIESLKIWRIDPRAMEREFFARPLDPAVADCWAKFIRAIKEALRSNPDCAQWLLGVAAELQQNFLGALAMKNPTQLEKFQIMGQEYRALWRAGRVDSPEMTALMVRFRDWMLAEDLIDPTDPNLKQIAEHPCMQKILKGLPSMDCDPQVGALLRAIAQDTSNATAN